MSKRKVAVWLALILALILVLGGVVVVYIQNNYPMAHQKVLVQLLDQRVIPQISSSLSELVKEIVRLYNAAIYRGTATEPNTVSEHIFKLNQCVLPLLERMRKELSQSCDF